MKYTIAILTVLVIIQASDATTERSPLQEDIDDFTKLLDMAAIKNVMMDYLISDQEVQEAVSYLSTDAFHNIFMTVQNLPEYKRFLHYLKEEKLDIVCVLESSCWGIIPGVTTPKPLANTHGVRGLLDDIVRLLPERKFQILYQIKMVISHHFRELVEHLHGQDVQVITSTIHSMQEYKDAVAWLNDRNVDVEEVKDYIYWLFTGKENEKN